MNKVLMKITLYSGEITPPPLPHHKTEDTGPPTHSVCWYLTGIINLALQTHWIFPHLSRNPVGIVYHYIIHGKPWWRGVTKCRPSTKISRLTNKVNELLICVCVYLTGRLESLLQPQLATEVMFTCPLHISPPRHTPQPR